MLLGYRGSGKTSVGKELAEQLWKDFVDIDVAICARFDGLTIAEIWQQHGEPKFREVEAEVTREVLTKDNQVIATGGGTPVQPGAKEAIRDASNCIRIYLHCDPDELSSRIAADDSTKGARPSLTGNGSASDEVREVLAVREPVYRELADEVFDVTYTSVEQAVRYLMSLV